MDGVFWRIGWPQSPADFTPHSYYSWDNRFDDIQRRFRSIYAAEECVTCFREVLHVYRPDTEALADFEEIFGTRPPILAGEVSYGFRRNRVLIPVRLGLISGEMVDVDDVALRTSLQRQSVPLVARSPLCQSLEGR